RSPHQPVRPLAGGLVVLPHDDAPLDRGDVALGRLDQPLAAGREVLAHPGRGDGQLVEVDDVEVGQVAGGDQPPVVEAEQGGVAAGLQVDRVLQRQPVAAAAVADPVGEHVAGDAGVAQQPAVGAAVAHAEDYTVSGQ